VLYFHLRTSPPSRAAGFFFQPRFLYSGWLPSVGCHSGVTEAAIAIVLMSRSGRYMAYGQWCLPANYPETSLVSPPDEFEECGHVDATSTVANSRDRCRSHCGYRRNRRGTIAAVAKGHTGIRHLSVSFRWRALRLSVRYASDNADRRGGFGRRGRGPIDVSDRYSIGFDQSFGAAASSR